VTRLLTANFQSLKRNVKLAYISLVGKAEGKHPVPFRTRKLSPPALMILHLSGVGK
jgi:hypothetical protein